MGNIYLNINRSMHLVLISVDIPHFFLFPFDIPDIAFVYMNYPSRAVNITFNQLKIESTIIRTESNEMSLIS